MPRLPAFPLLLAGLIFLSGCHDMSPTQQQRQARIKASPQHPGKTFQNPIPLPWMIEGKFWDYAYRQTIAPRVDPTPLGQVPVLPWDRKAWLAQDQNHLAFVWLGHSSLLVQLQGVNILVDPVLEERASPFTWVGPKRFHPAPAKAQDLDLVDLVLITHDHYDHLEEPTMRALAATAKKFVVPLGIGALLEEWGVPVEKIQELDWWESTEWQGLQVTLTPAVHYASRGLFDRNQRLWSSLAVRGREQSFFVSGDSGYWPGFQEIGQRLGPFDLAFLKIGSYDESWKHIHLTPEEAVQEHQDVRAKQLVPLHWATFDLGLHPWYEPMERLKAAAEAQGVAYLTPLVGQKVDSQALPLPSLWWRQVIAGAKER